MTEKQKTLLIERYLKGELPDAERQEVERMAENDAQFAEDISLMHVVLSTLEDRDLVQFHRDITAAWDAEDGDEKEGPELETPVAPDTLQVGWSRRRWLLAAALLIAIVVIGLWQYYRLQQPSPIVNKPETSEKQEQTPEILIPPREEEAPAPPTRPQAQNPQSKPQPNRQYIAMAKTHYGYAPDFANIRKTGANALPDSLTPLQRAERAFADKQYDKVIQLLAQPDAKVRESSLYLRGHAHFNAGHYKAAARDFRSVAEMKGFSLDNATWYMLLRDLAIYGPTDANVQAQLKSILTDLGHPYNDAAKKLQSEIRR